jgi:cytochrome c oxidase assembly protein subunit 15
MLGNKWAFRLTVVSALLAFTVILLGATTRLKEAGLACPDWPGCYGQLVVPHRPLAIAGQILDPKKAWAEMIHRYAAAMLVLLSFAAVVLIFQQRKLPNQPVKLAFSLLILLFFQGLLGKWTVTLHLHPLVVMTHLLGGLTLLSLLWMLILQLHPIFSHDFTKQEKKLRLLAAIGLFLIIVQITLGGWTSSNYAAFVCADFPSCQGHWWPTMNFREGFNLWASASRNFEEGYLSSDARTAIHMVHRIGALATALYLIFLAWKLRKTSNKIILQVIGLLLLIFLILQITLGILNVIWLLPLPIAVAHNGVATLLLLTLLTLLVFLTKNEHTYSA